MAINLGDNIKIQGNLPIDYRYFNNLVPYTSTGQVDSIIPIGERYLGLTVNINNVEYWYADSVADGNLVLKINAGTLIGATNGLSISGTSVILGGSNLSIPTIITRGVGNTAGIEYDSGGDITSFADNSLVTKKYVDLFAMGLHPKLAVEVATTIGDGNIDLTTGGLLTIDGFSGLVAGNRVLVKNQTNGSENGIYIASGSTWLRSGDFDFTPSGETFQGTLIPVVTGSTNKNSIWVLITDNPITGGTQILEFGLFSSPTFNAGVGINILGSTVSIKDLAGDSLTWNVGTEKLSVDTTTGGLATALGNKLNTSDYVTYTGSTQPILNAALTGATNGLSYSNRCVCLGGNLNTDTIIDGQNSNELKFTNLTGFQVSGGTSEIILEPLGITLAFSGQSVSFDSNRGLEYTNVSSANFSDCSLITKEYADGIASGNTIYCAPLKQYSNVEVGGVPTATDLYGLTSNQILEKILVKYLTPTFSSFSVGGLTSPVEVGTSISGNKTFSWLFTNSGNVQPMTMCIRDVNLGSSLIANTTTTSPISVGITPKTFVNCGEVQSWCGCARNTCGTQFGSLNYTISALLPYYWGVVSVPGPIGAGRPLASSINVTGGTRVFLSSSIELDVPFNSLTTPSTYLWFAVPSTVTKSSWYVSSFSFGNIGGAVGVGLGFNLFPAPDLKTVSTTLWSKPYNVYISNWQTSPDAGMLIN